jgi:hypothetical protein
MNRDMDVKQADEIEDFSAFSKLGGLATHLASERSARRARWHSPN